MRLLLLAVVVVGSFISGAMLQAEQTGTPRRLLIADYSTRKIAVVDRDGKLGWQHKLKSEVHDAWLLPNGNILFQTDLQHLYEITPDMKIVWQYNAAKQNGNAGKKVEVHSFQRLPDGNTMIAESGPARIIEVDHEGKLKHEVKFTLDTPNPHRDTRLARKTDAGTYLVCHEGDNCVREYDSSGKVIWKYPVGKQLYSAVRLKNGNTLIGTGNGNSVIEVDKGGKTVWSITKDELPGVTLGWITVVERLTNGNTVIVNCHAGKQNPQIVEVTPDKKVVWTFKDFENFGNSLPVAQVLDEQGVQR